jgi:hypothetical protein
MPKKQYNARLEPDAIENLQAIAQANGVSVAEVIEASAYWLAGNDRALADCPLAMREAIANRSGQDSIAPVPAHPATPAAALDTEALTEAIAQAIAPVLARVEAVEQELKNADGAIAA